jgi:DNA repair photolyase
MRIQAGLKREDWEHWGRHTTFKQNAAQLLIKQLRQDQKIYCSPLTDAYQPAEQSALVMPEILSALLLRPPSCLVIQTRSPLILRDLPLLSRGKNFIRVSFSLTTADEQVRRWYEPNCATTPERLETIQALRKAGLAVFATLAPLLPGDAHQLLDWAMQATDLPVILDPLHTRQNKPQGATTKAAAEQIARVHKHEPWFQSEFQRNLVAQLIDHATTKGRIAAAGIEGFRLLNQPLR